MATAIKVHELAETGARLATPPMASAGPTLGDEAGGVQGLLHEAVGHGDAVVAPCDVIEVAHVEAGVAIARAVAIATEGQEALHLGERDRARRGRAAPVIVEPIKPARLVPQSQPPHS